MASDLKEDERESELESLRGLLAERGIELRHEPLHDRGGHRVSTDPAVLLRNVGCMKARPGQRV